MIRHLFTATFMAISHILDNNLLKSTSKKYLRCHQLPLDSPWHPLYRRHCNSLLVVNTFICCITWLSRNTSFHTKCLRKTLLYNRSFQKNYSFFKNDFTIFCPCFRAEGALGLPMTYDNHPIQSNPIPKYSIEYDLS